LRGREQTKGNAWTTELGALCEEGIEVDRIDGDGVTPVGRGGTGSPTSPLVNELNGRVEAEKLSAERGSHSQEVAVDVPPRHILGSLLLAEIDKNVPGLRKVVP
jgi:hypothetical protein